MNKTSPQLIVNAWLDQRARALRAAAERAERTNESGRLVSAAHAYAERLRAAALVLERPLQVT
jgi:hypothetical protein